MKLPPLHVHMDEGHTVSIEPSRTLAASWTDEGVSVWYFDVDGFIDRVNLYGDRWMLRYVREALGLHDVE